MNIEISHTLNCCFAEQAVSSEVDGLSGRALVVSCNSWAEVKLQSA